MEEDKSGQNYTNDMVSALYWICSPQTFGEKKRLHLKTMMGRLEYDIVHDNSEGMFGSDLKMVKIIFVIFKITLKHVFDDSKINFDDVKNHECRIKHEIDFE